MTSLALLIRNSVVLLAGTVVSKGLVFLSLLVLTRKLGAAGFGRFTSLFVYVSFFSVVIDAGIESIVIREISKRPEEAPRRLGDALLLRGLLVAVSIVGAVLLYPTVFDEKAPVGLLLLASMSLIVSNRAASLRSLFELPYRASLRMGIPTLLNVLTECLFLAILVETASRWGLVGAVATQALAPLPFAWLLAWLVLRRTPASILPDPKRLIALLGAAAPLLGAMILNIVLTRCDVILLGRMRGPTEVGIYSAPVRLVEVAALLPILLMTSLYPMFSESHHSDPRRLERLFRGAIRFVVAAVVPVAVIEIAYAPAIVSRLFGPEYAAGAAILPVLAIGEVLVAADIVFSSRLIATHLERGNLVIVLAAAVTNVAANIMLIPAHGALGAAYATLLAYLVRLAIAFAWKETRVPAWGTLVSILPAIAAGAGALVVLLGLKLESPVLIVPAAALYLALLVLFRGFSQREWDLLREIPRSLARTPRELPEAGA